MQQKMCAAFKKIYIMFEKGTYYISSQYSG